MTEFAPLLYFWRLEDSTNSVCKPFHILAVAKVKLLESCVVLNLTEENQIIFAAAACLVFAQAKMNTEDACCCSKFYATNITSTLCVCATDQH